MFVLWFSIPVNSNSHIIMKTCPYNVYPLEPHFYIAKLGYAGVYLFLARLHEVHRAIVVTSVVSVYVYVYVYVRVRVTLSVKVFKIVIS